MTEANAPAYPVDQWKPINGYEGLYEVSYSGQVRSKDRLIVYSNNRQELRKGKILKIIVNIRNGYCYVNLCKNKEMKGKRLHRLVATAFCENPQNLPEVNHKDYNKQNNIANNLEWVDKYAQAQHAAKKVGRKWQNHRQGKVGKENPKSKPIWAFRLDGSFIGEYESARLAAKATKSDQSKITACCRSKRKSHNKMHFEYKPYLRTIKTSTTMNSYNGNQTVMLKLIEV